MTWRGMSVASRPSTRAINLRSHNSRVSLVAPFPGRRRACVLFEVSLRGGYSPTGLPDDTLWLCFPPTGWGWLGVLSHDGTVARWECACSEPEMMLQIKFLSWLDAPKVSHGQRDHAEFASGVMTVSRHREELKKAQRNKGQNDANRVMIAEPQICPSNSNRLERHIAINKGVKTLHGLFLLLDQVQRYSLSSASPPPPTDRSRRPRHCRPSPYMLL